LEVGDTFLNKVSTLWMKTNEFIYSPKAEDIEKVNAVCLSTGVHHYFSDLTNVLEVDIDMLVK
jgi:general stress protein 26